MDKLVDVTWTQRWLSHNPFDIATSDRLSKLMGHKIKCILRVLPTTDILHRNYPEVIPELMSCLRCNKHIETNYHLWNCQDSQIYITNAQSTLSRSIVALIVQFKEDSCNVREITNYVRNLHLFKAPALDPDEFSSHPFVLFCNNLIPVQLIKIFSVFKISLKHYKQPLLDILSIVHKYIYNNIWKARSHSFKLWKESNNITKSSFQKSDKATGSSTTGVSSQQRRARSSNRSHPQLRSPLSVPPASRVYDDADWIRWTSSNFLHSIPWHNALYLDNCYTHSD